MTLSTLTPATFSVTHRDRLDAVVTIRFTPADPIGLTEVDIAGEHNTADLLDLLDAVCERLSVYVRDFRAAMRDDAI